MGGGSADFIFMGGDFSDKSTPKIGRKLVPGENRRKVSDTVFETLTVFDVAPFRWPVCGLLII